MKKVPWKMICRVGGYTLVGVASVLSAMDADEKTQVFIKAIAEKSLNFVKKQES